MGETWEGEVSEVVIKGLFCCSVFFGALLAGLDFSAAQRVPQASHWDRRVVACVRSDVVNFHVLPLTLEDSSGSPHLVGAQFDGGKTARLIQILIGYGTIGFGVPRRHLAAVPTQKLDSGLFTVLAWFEGTSPFVVINHRDAIGRNFAQGAIEKILAAASQHGHMLVRFRVPFFVGHHFAETIGNVVDRFSDRDLTVVVAVAKAHDRLAKSNIDLTASGLLFLAAAERHQITGDGNLVRIRLGLCRKLCSQVLGTKIEVVDVRSGTGVTVERDTDKILILRRTRNRVVKF